MNWRSLLFLPLAALCVGSPAKAPRIQTAIPKPTDSGLYEDAHRNFLFAYAYRQEKPAVAQAFCRKAQVAAEQCGPEAETLRLRIAKLCDF